MTDFHEPIRFGAYEIIEQVGVGAQGWVYKARCLEARDASKCHPGQIVALKVLSPHKGSDEQRRAFLDRIRTLGALSHPHIVGYLDGFFDRQRGMEYPCMVMDFLEGETLQQKIDRLAVPPGSPKEGLPWERIQPIINQAADALIYVENQGITHCDLKPSNLFVTTEEKIKILDFDLARIFQVKQGSKSAGVRGTYDYMAPDFTLVKEFKGDQQSDVYSLGACLYAAVVGVPPYPVPAERGLPREPMEDADYYTLWNTSPPRGVPWHPSLDVHSSELRETLERALAVNRADRHKTFGDFKRDFDRVTRRTLRGSSGEYRLLRFIGEGGFGRVYEAQRVSDMERVAVKHLIKKAANDIQRFKKEAERLAVLSADKHNHIVHYIDFIVESGRLPDLNEHYLILELLPGMPGNTLADRIEKALGHPAGASDARDRTPTRDETQLALPTAPEARPKKEFAAERTEVSSSQSGFVLRLEPEEVVNLFQGYAQGLIKMHAHGIVHRDIKPNNLYAPPFDYTDAKIFDFGISRRKGTVFLSGGLIVGTLSYMPPEIGRSNGRHEAKDDMRRDIYSLGICLYEALTLKRPFSNAEHSWENYVRRCQDARLCELDYDHPVFLRYPGLKIIIQKATAYNLGERFPHAGEFLEALMAWENPDPVRRRPSTGVAGSGLNSTILVDVGRIRKIGLARKWIRGGLILAGGTAGTLAFFLAWGLVPGCQFSRLNQREYQIPTQNIQDRLAAIADVERQAVRTRVWDRAPFFKPQPWADLLEKLRKDRESIPAEIRGVIEAGIRSQNDINRAEALLAWVRGLDAAGRAALFPQDEHAAYVEGLDRLFSQHRANLWMDQWRRRLPQELNVSLVDTVEADLVQAFEFARQGVLSGSASDGLAPATNRIDLLFQEYLARSLDTLTPDAAESNKLAELDRLATRAPTLWGLNPALYRIKLEDLHQSYAALVKDESRFLEKIQQSAETLASNNAELRKNALNAELLGKAIDALSKTRQLKDRDPAQALKKEWDACAVLLRTNLLSQLSQRDPLDNRKSRLDRLSSLTADLKGVLAPEYVAHLESRLNLELRTQVIRAVNRSGVDVQVALQMPDQVPRTLPAQKAGEWLFEVTSGLSRVELKIDGPAGYRAELRTVAVQGGGGIQLDIPPLSLLPISVEWRGDRIPTNPPVTLSYRLKDVEVWSPWPMEVAAFLPKALTLNPGIYEILMERPDYHSVTQTMEVKIGDIRLVRNLPEEWVPTVALQQLQNLQRAMDAEDYSRLEPLMAAPAPDLKWATHVNRYKGLTEKWKNTDQGRILSNLAGADKSIREICRWLYQVGDPEMGIGFLRVMQDAPPPFEPITVLIRLDSDPRWRLALKRINAWSKAAGQMGNPSVRRDLSAELRALRDDALKAGELGLARQCFYESEILRISDPTVSDRNLNSDLLSQGSGMAEIWNFRAHRAYQSGSPAKEELNYLQTYANQKGVINEYDVLLACFMAYYSWQNIAANLPGDNERSKRIAAEQTMTALLVQQALATVIQSASGEELERAFTRLKTKAVGHRGRADENVGLFLLRIIQFMPGLPPASPARTSSAKWFQQGDIRALWANSPDSFKKRVEATIKIIGGETGGVLE